MIAKYTKLLLHFKRPSGTSRGILKNKEAWFITLFEGDKTGIGECGMLRGLSIDDRPDFESKLKWACDNIHLGLEILYNELTAFPSIQFGLEQAFLSLKGRSPFLLFPSAFTEGTSNIQINGLIWMGGEAYMKQQIREKLDQGFACIKMKIGALDFETELSLLKSVRQEFTANEVELRVDANGAFDAKPALEKLNRLAVHQLHSIEQPIKPGQFEEMSRLCEHSPIPIALDEELIGVFDKTKKKELLKTIKPQYVILKPSFIGGYKGALEWIDLAVDQNTAWWITSALESNIGLNAIAQWTFLLKNTMPQGLGTGSLYTNNFLSPLRAENGILRYETNTAWQVDLDQ